MSISYRFICYGKNIENLHISVDKLLVGSASSTFVERIEEKDILFLYASSSIWGMAEAVGHGLKCEERIWSDKVYPYRYKIKNLSLLTRPVLFGDLNFNGRLREALGRSWSYKVLFTPAEIPQDIGKEIYKKLLAKKSFKSLSPEVIQQHFLDNKFLGKRRPSK